MIRSIDTPQDRINTLDLRQMSWAWSWVGRESDDKTIGIAIWVRSRTLLLLWRLP